MPKLWPRFILSVLMCVCVTLPAAAISSFTVQHIEFQGLKRTPENTVLNYLPIKTGGTADSHTVSQAIKALYKTGFFSNVSMSRHQDTLVVKVVEREVIAKISILGNDEMSTDKLQDALKDAGLSEGRVLNEAILANMSKALLQLYHEQSFYDAQVTPKITRTSRRQALVELHVKEGPVAKIKHISIIGNKSFDEHELLGQMHLSTGHWWSFFTHDNHYSETKLGQDVAALQAFYMDRGYINFQLADKHVKISDDKKAVDITLTVEEGAKYTFAGYQLRGELKLTPQQQAELITLQPGHVFSRKAVLEANRKLGEYLADKGYAFSRVQAIPQANSKTHQVRLIFEVHPGKPVLVRRIHFIGNTKTADNVLRREARQLEGSVYGLDKVKLTQRRLSRLGFLKNVRYMVNPVPQHSDVVDIDFYVTEASSTTASLQMGYSDHEGLLFGANFDQSNFLGTGDRLAFNLERSELSKVISLNRVNPYFTSDGVSLSSSVFYRRTTPGRVNISNYTTGSYGFTMGYGFPYTENDQINLGYGYEHMQLGDYSGASTQVENYVTTYGASHDIFKVNIGWDHNSLNRAIFPTKGIKQTASAEVGLPLGGSSLDYYKAFYGFSGYLPLWANNPDWVLNVNASLGYGRGYGDKGSDLPFFKNFYAGGINTVRGYESNSLGPRDSNNKALGANVLTVANVNIIFPNPAGEDIRSALFVDVGNVFGDKFEAGDLRMTAGVAVQWRTVVAPLVFSFGTPLKRFDGDHKQAFQFSISTRL